MFLKADIFANLEWFKRQSPRGLPGFLFTVSMVRCVSCILLLHFVFSIFIVAERLASDYDAWDDSEEHKKLNKSTLGKGGDVGVRPDKRQRS